MFKVKNYFTERKKKTEKLGKWPSLVSQLLNFLKALESKKVIRMVTLRENTKRMHCLKLLHAIQYLRKRINQEKKRKKKEVNSRI